MDACICEGISIAGGIPKRRIAWETGACSTSRDASYPKKRVSMHTGSKQYLSVLDLAQCSLLPTHDTPFATLRSSSMRAPNLHPLYTEPPNAACSGMDYGEVNSWTHGSNFQQRAFCSWLPRACPHTFSTICEAAEPWNRLSSVQPSLASSCVCRRQGK